MLLKQAGEIMYYSLLLSILVFTFMRESQPKEIIIDKSKIQWDENRKLTWEDFRGNPRAGSQFSAESSLQITYGMQISQQSGNTKVKFNVSCYFEKEESWVKPGKQKNTLLAHEQRHFDIAEIFARKLRKRFNDNEFDLKNYETKSTAIFDKTFLEYQSYQSAYDTDTHHGSNEEEQQKWEAKIIEYLKKSDKYKKD